MAGFFIPYHGSLFAIILQRQKGKESSLIDDTPRGMENGKKSFPITSRNLPYLCIVKTRQALFEILTIPPKDKTADIS